MLRILKHLNGNTNFDVKDIKNIWYLFCRYDVKKQKEN